MATTSEVDAHLGAIGDEITAVKIRFAAQKSAMVGGSAALGDIPTKNPKRIDVLATVDGYVGTPPLYEDATPFEGGAKDKKERLRIEFLALKAELDVVIAGF